MSGWLLDRGHRAYMSRMGGHVTDPRDKPDRLLALPHALPHTQARLQKLLSQLLHVVLHADLLFLFTRPCPLNHGRRLHTSKNQLQRLKIAPLNEQDNVVHYPKHLLQYQIVILVSTLSSFEGLHYDTIIITTQALLHLTTINTAPYPEGCKQGFRENPQQNVDT